MSHIYIENLQSLDYNFKDRDVVHFVCKNCGKNNTMLWKNYKKTKFSICSVCKRESTMMGKYKGKTTLTSELKEKVAETNSIKYGQKSPAWKKRLHHFEGEVFESSSELSVWICYKKDNIPIKMARDKVCFKNWFFNSVFILDDIIKVIVRSEEIFNIVPLENLDEVLAFFKENNIKLVLPNELKEYKRSIAKEYGKDFFSNCRLS